MNDLERQLYKNLVDEGRELLAEVAPELNSFLELTYATDNLQPGELPERHHTTYIELCLALALYKRGE